VSFFILAIEKLESKSELIIFTLSSWHKGFLKKWKVGAPCIFPFLIYSEPHGGCWFYAIKMYVIVSHLLEVQLSSIWSPFYPKAAFSRSSQASQDTVPCCFKASTKGKDVTCILGLGRQFSQLVFVHNYTCVMMKPLYIHTRVQFLPYVARYLIPSHMKMKTRLIWFTMT